ncbi:MAG: hypothetical protein ACRD22_04275 [Terriglobia bacterium]
MQTGRSSGTYRAAFAVKLAIVVSMLGLPVSAQAQSAQASAANRLLTARIAYVAPMPDNLDQWLIEDLKAWGKYQITGNSQGVDLVIRAKKSKEERHYVIRNGQVQPRPAKKPAVLSIAVVDWVTGAKLWQANILNESPKKNAVPPDGPETDIYARRMTPDQIAQRCATRLREYVEGLEKAEK